MSESTKRWRTNIYSSRHFKVYCEEIVSNEFERLQYVRTTNSRLLSRIAIFVPRSSQDIENCHDQSFSTMMCTLVLMIFSLMMRRFEESEDIGSFGSFVFLFF